MEKRILIVEDDKEISSMLASFLEQKGYLVWTALDGASASMKIKERKYDLILMDLMLPLKSGEQLIKELRREFDTR